MIEELTIFYIDKLKKLETNYWAIHNINSILKSWILKPQYIYDHTCGFSDVTNVIDVNGDIYPCQCFVENKDFVMGNVKSPYTLKKFNNNIKEQGTCKKCSIKHLCRLQCYYDNYITQGDIYKANKFRCAIQKELIKAAAYILFFLKSNPLILKKYTTFLKLMDKYPN